MSPEVAEVRVDRQLIRQGLLPLLNESRLEERYYIEASETWTGEGKTWRFRGWKDHVKSRVRKLKMRYLRRLVALYELEVEGNE